MYVDVPEAALPYPLNNDRHKEEEDPDSSPTVPFPYHVPLYWILRILHC